MAELVTAAKDGKNPNNLEYDDTLETKGRPIKETSELSGSEEDVPGNKKNPFRDPVVAHHWREVYEQSKYECRHVFDPSLTWSEEEEKRLVRKLDWRVCLWAVSFYCTKTDVDTERKGEKRGFVESFRQM